VVLSAFVLVTYLDSLHFRRVLPTEPGQAVAYSTRVESVLDVLLAKPIAMREVSYSYPFAYENLSKETVGEGATAKRELTRLKFGGAHLKTPETEWFGDVMQKLGGGALLGLGFAALLCVAIGFFAKSKDASVGAYLASVRANETVLPVRAGFITLFILCAVLGAAFFAMSSYHVLGTDKTGNDVFVQALKSIRTAFVIGSLSTLATLPFAIVLGVLAGYFGGWVDDVIQYLYTTLSSIPNVLLIAACVLMAQVFIDKNPELFETGIERADLRTLLLCVILGLTGWAQLCRLVRAETMKLRELEFVQAANAFGVRHAQIMGKHILPNVMHLVLITTVLSFSELVLYEAVLSYVGVGVDPTTSSFGGMINLARSEMSRDPVVWWSFAAAFGFMVALVLAANLFADGVRDAFDPRARGFRARLAKLASPKVVPNA
jgi:peptide/nickel transport system permease protein